MAIHDSYDWWMLAATWFSALGTLAAIAVALWLSTQDRRPSVKVSAGVYQIPLAGQMLKDAALVFVVKVANTGTRELEISGVHWRFGYFSSAAAVMLLGDYPLSAKLPSHLSPGRSTMFMQLHSDFLKDGGIITQHFPKKRWSPKRVRVGVYLATGEEIMIRPSFQDLMAIAGRTLDGPAAPS